MSIIYHPDLIQGSDDWIIQRLGCLTASEMHMFVTPTLKVANNDKTRSHVFELSAQRISGYVEPSYISDDMLRGMEGEAIARQHYAAHYAPVQEVGFVTNDELGFKIGFSPDGLVGDDGIIEIKGRRQKFQIQTLVSGVMPDDYLIQVQAGLFVTKRKWCDYISFSGGLPMAVVRVGPDPAVQAAIAEAATIAEGQIKDTVAAYYATITKLKADKKLIPTERRVEQEITL